MRVGLNAYFLSHPHTGSGVYLRRLLETLPAAAPGIELRLYVPRGLATPGAAPDLPLRRVPVPGAPDGNWAKLHFEQVGFPRAALGDGCDVLHVPYFAPCSLGRRMAVATIHDVIPLMLRGYSHGLLPWAYSRLVATAARRTRLLLADSKWTARDAVQRLGVPPGRLRVVYLGVGREHHPVRDVSRLAEVRRRYELPEDYVLYLSGFDRRKRVEVLLAAYAHLRSETPITPSLVLAGRLPERQTVTHTGVRSLIERLGLAGEVLLPGEVAECDKPALLVAASLFVFPSEYEGFGLTPLEAMACGAPVVAVNASSIPEVCAGAADLVRPGDEGALAAAMGRLLADPAHAEELRRRGPERAAAFTWERTATETARVYAAVAAMGR